MIWLQPVSIYQNNFGILGLSIFPLIFYIYWIHWHYELLVVFSILLLIYWLKIRNIFLMSLGFAIWFVTKYFTVIFTPFILLYIYKEFWIKKSIFFIVYTLIFVILSFLHLVVDRDLLVQTFWSILQLSAPNSPDGISIIQLKSINFLSALNYLLWGNTPINNIANSILFYIWSNWIMVSAILITLLVFRDIYSIFKLKNPYHFNDVIKSMFLSVLLLLLFLWNFQTHYIWWLVPFLLIFIFRGRIFLHILLILSLVWFIYAFRWEVGIRTYFMDLFWENYIHGLNSINYLSIYLEWSIIILTVLLLIVVLFTK